MKMGALELLIPIVAILMPLVLVPTIIRMKHAAKLREWEHRERIRALELGVSPLEPSRKTGLFWPSLAVAAIGAGVPTGSFLIAWVATLTTHVDEEVWLAATVVGVTAILGATALGFRLIGQADWLPEGGSSSHAKPPHLDPDAYDTVGRRG